MSTADALRAAARDALATGRWHDGARALNALAALAPTDARIWFNMAMCWRRLNRPAAADGPLRRTLVCAPDHRAGWLERGAFDGTPATDRAAICAPEWPAAWNAWADRHHRAGDDRRASLGFRRAVTLDPGDGGAWFNLTQTLAADTSDAPVRLLFRAIASGRAPTAAFEHVAAMVQRQGDATAAIPLYRAVLRQQPENADLHANLAAALIESGAVAAALAALETALTLDPDLARARWMRAWITLSTGDLARGYADFDCRWRPANAGSRQHLFGFPLWDGGRLDGPLLIWGETGLGDEVLFAGLVQEAAARCGQPVILECDARLVALFARACPNATVVARQTPPAQTIATIRPAAQCSSLRLPLFLRREWGDFPDRRRYLSAAPRRRRAAWRRLRGIADGPRVGLAWRSANARTGGRKSLPLAAFRPLIESCPEVNFISLQYGDNGEEIALLREAGLTNLHANPNPDLIGDIDDLAAQIACLDGVVTISGVNAHMAGALGRPGVVLMQKDPLWYWFRSGDASPWYPCLRLLREGPTDGFAAALASAPAALRAALAGG